MRWRMSWLELCKNLLRRLTLLTLVELKVSSSSSFIFILFSSGEPENSDPYNDNGLSRVVNPGQNVQSDNFNSNDNLFDDDFEETVDLERVAAIERQNQEIKTTESCFGNVYNQKQTRETKETMEELLEDIDFEPLENWLVLQLTK